MNRINLFSICCLVSISPLYGADEKKPDDKPKINYAEHVLPIFRQHCLKCHNANDAKGGLAIDSYAALMEGGGSGEVVYDGDSASSRLYQLMTHEDTPIMPPNQDPLPTEQLDIVRQWIDGGLLENSGSKAKKKKGPSLTFTSLGAGGKPDVISMPESVWRVPVVTTARAPAASAIATSPWAPLVALGGHRQVSLYHTETGELLGIIPYPEGIPQVICFSNAGDYIMVAGGTHASLGTAAVYDVKTGQRMLRVGEEFDTVFGADINDSMTRIAMGGPQRMLNIYDTSTGETVFNLKKHTDWIYCVDYSPDGVLLASGDRAGGLHVWEADTGRLYLDLVGHKAAVRAITWRADSNLLASASEDGTVKLWEMTEGKQLKSFTAHGGGATGIAMAADGRIATSGKDRTVKLWKADGAGLKTFPAFAEPALEVAISHDGTKIIGGDWLGRTIVWNADDPTKAKELAANPAALQQQHDQAVAKLKELDAVVVKTTEQQTSKEQGLAGAKANLDAAGKRLTDTKAAIGAATTAKAAAEKQLAELKTQLAQAKQNQAAAKQNVATLTGQFDSVTKQHQAMTKQMSDATVRRDTARKQKSEIEKQLASANAELISANKAKADAVAKVGNLKQQVAEAGTKQQLSTAAEAKAETELKAEQAKLAELEKKEDAPAADVEAVKKRLGELTAARDNAKKDKDAMIAKLAELSPQLTAAEQGIPVADGKLTALAKQQSELTAKSKSLAETDGAEEAARKVAEAKAVELAAALAKHQSNLAAAATGLKTADAGVAGLAAKIAAKPAEIAEQAKQIQQMTAAIPGIETQIAATKKAFDDATTALAKAKTDNASAVTVAKLARERIEGLKAELVSFGDATARLAEAVKAAETAAQQKIAALQNPSAEAEKIATEIAARGAALANAEAEMKKLQAQIAELQKVQTAQQQKLAGVKTTLSELQAAADAAASDAEAKQDNLKFFESAYGSR